MKRRLIVNADDFGLTTGVNDGIMFAHRRGLVRSASLMANSRASRHAIELARDAPALDIGCHLVLTDGIAMASSGTELPGSTWELLLSIVAGRLRLLDEMSAQVEILLSAGICVSHLDTHKSVHLLPPVMDAIVRVSAKYRIPRIRIPIDFGWRKGPMSPTASATHLALRLMETPLRRRLSHQQCRTTDHFTGLHMSGRFESSDLARLFRELPAGTTELMCHPGYCTEELLATNTHLTIGREREMAALTGAETQVAAAENDIELVSYREV